MDNETKITNEQINSVINDFGSAQKRDTESLGDILKKNLSEDQLASLENFLQDRDKMERLLSSPMAKAFLQKYMKNGE